MERSFCSGTWEGRMPVVFSGARYVSPALCCALFGVRGSSGVNSGALCSTGAGRVRFRLSLLRERVQSLGTY